MKYGTESVLQALQSPARSAHGHQNTTPLHKLCTGLQESIVFNKKPSAVFVLKCISRVDALLREQQRALRTFCSFLFPRRLRATYGISVLVSRHYGRTFTVHIQLRVTDADIEGFTRPEH